MSWQVAGFKKKRKKKKIWVLPGPVRTTVRTGTTDLFILSKDKQPILTVREVLSCKILLEARCCEAYCHVNKEEHPLVENIGGYRHRTHLSPHTWPFVTRYLNSASSAENTNQIPGKETRAVSTRSQPPVQPSDLVVVPLLHLWPSSRCRDFIPKMGTSAPAKWSRAKLNVSFTWALHTKAELWDNRSVDVPAPLQAQPVLPSQAAPEHLTKAPFPILH